MKSITVAKAQERLLDLLKELSNEPITLTQDGKPLAVLLSPGGYERLLRAYDQVRRISQTLKESGLAAADLYEVSRELEDSVTLRQDLPFIPGEVYIRRVIHEQYGGQRQGGISTPKNFPYIFLFSAKKGEDFGYHDEEQEDGLYKYFGEGVFGDMQFVRGNRAIRDHVGDSKKLLLFRGLPGGKCEFVSEMELVDYHKEPAQDFSGRQRSAICFRLRYVAPRRLGAETTQFQETEAEQLVKTPREAFWKPVLSALVDLGGSGTLDQVKQLVEGKMASILNEYDYEQLPQSHRLRWENDVEWARFDLVAEGFIADNSARGIWKVTEAGRDWLAGKSG
ncbi:MAG: type II toxin-antitoxin system Phd/YefM family antitoxin [Anaerolineales bacterium]|nr:type II toxin-antitoxin system Phd/YefM family antitoxin [Anaerolineales bacterium]